MASTSADRRPLLAIVDGHAGDMTSNDGHVYHVTDGPYIAVNQAGATDNASPPADDADDAHITQAWVLVKTEQEQSGLSATTCQM